MTSSAEREVDAAWSGLTPAEIDVMRLLAAAGYGAVYIAKRLACRAEAIEMQARRLGIEFAKRPKA